MRSPDSTRSRGALRERENAEVRRGRSKQQRVDAVEHAAVAAQEATRVLHFHVSLQLRLEEVPERRRHRDHDTKDDRLRDRQEVLLVERYEGDEDGEDRPEDESLPRLA